MHKGACIYKILERGGGGQAKGNHTYAYESVCIHKTLHQDIHTHHFPLTYIRSFSVLHNLKYNSTPVGKEFVTLNRACVLLK